MPSSITYVHAMLRQAPPSAFLPPAAPASAFGARIRQQRRGAASPRKAHAPVACSATLLSDAVVRLPSAAGRVDVSLRVEDLGGRRRRVSGGVDVPASAERIWRVLTSYERNADYIPNVVSSEVRREGGAVLLDQVGILSNKLRLRSRIVLRVHERRDEWRIAFTREQCRDFAEFDGEYRIEHEDDGGDSCRLLYSVLARPLAFYPMALVERKITKEVPGMLAAIRVESELAKFIPL